MFGALVAKSEAVLISVGLPLPRLCQLVGVVVAGVNDEYKSCAHTKNPKAHYRRKLVQQAPRLAMKVVLQALSLRQAIGFEQHNRFPHYGAGTAKQSQPLFCVMAMSVTNIKL